LTKNVLLLINSEDILALHELWVPFFPPVELSKLKNPPSKVSSFTKLLIEAAKYHLSLIPNFDLIIKGGFTPV
jgi:hypothetical protein